jgi:hypothetical protein
VVFAGPVLWGFVKGDREGHVGDDVVTSLLLASSGVRVQRCREHVVGAVTCMKSMCGEDRAAYDVTKLRETVTSSEDDRDGAWNRCPDRR